MDRIKEINQRLVAIADRQKALKSNYDKNKTFSAEERDEAKALREEAATLKAERTSLETLAAEDKALLDEAANLSAELNKSNGRKTQPDTLASTRIEAVAPDKFRTLGEQLLAVANAAKVVQSGGGSIDNRLKWETLAPASGSAVAGMPSDGGYLIQKDFSTALLSRMNEIGSVKSRVNSIPVSADSDGLELPVVDETSRATGSRWGGVQVYWGAENDAATAKKPKFRKMTLELKELIGLAYASNRLLRDASAVGAVFSQAFSEEMNFMIEDALFNGLGGGQPLGILNSGAVVSVSKETGQAAASIVFENIVKMYSRLWARSRPRAAWFINQDCEPQLQTMSIGVGAAGQPVYLPPGGLSEAPYGRLMGLPVIPVEYCATVGTVGDIILADFSQVVAIEKDGLQADSSIHVRFTTNENTFRFIYRYDAQPTWNSALTPFKGSNTQSPFITLATRA